MSRNFDVHVSAYFLTLLSCLLFGQLLLEHFLNNYLGCCLSKQRTGDEKLRELEEMMEGSGR